MKRLFACASVLALSAPSLVLAQTSGAGAPPAAADQVEEVVVTGSRITRDGFQAPTPVTVVGAEQLQERAITRIVDVSRSLPQFRNQGGAQSGSNSSANGGQGKLDLRGLGANRNLIMLDRRRVVPSTGNGIVDVNILPSALVSRIDIVTGGASAAYGSDAVSGVVNFVLDTKFQGLKGEVSGGMSSHRDNEEAQFSLAGGKHFLDGRLRAIGSLEYYQNGRQALLDRDWLAKKPGIINNPAYTATNGQVQRLVVSEGIVTAYMTHGGLVNGCRTASGANIANCALKGTAFGPGGTPYQFVYGTYVNPTGNMIAPPGSDYTNYYTQLYDGINVVNPSERESAFGHVEYDLAANVTAFAEGIYTKSKIGPSYTVPPYRFGTSATTWLSVSADNAYLPASIKAQMSGAGGGNPSGPAFLNIGRINDDWFGNMKVQNTNTTYRGVVGLKGDLSRSWKWDAYYQYGENTYYGTIDGNLVVANANLAVDAIAAPAGNAAGVATGTIVCRSTLTNPTNGCSPLNIFGVGAASAAAIDYVTEQQWTDQTYTQHVLEASIEGDLFSTWAGPVNFAGGASYRAEKIKATSDPLSIASAFVVGNPQPYAGKYNVKEAFAELGVPLLKDSPLGKSLDLNLAGRITDYSLSGTVNTWKVGATYKPTDEFMLRFTRSRDIRAPSLQELYTGAVTARVSVVDPTKSSSTTVNATQLTGGNASLKPEIADTLSGGIVYQPAWLPGFSASIDYYKIEINDVISTLTSQNIVDRCAAGNAALCNQITRVNGDITQIRSTNLNLNYLKTSGLDIEVGYRAPFAGGTIGVRGLANYVDEFVTSDGVTAVDLAGSIASAASTGSGSSTPSQPHWTLQASYFYERGPYQLTVTNRYVGSGVIDNAYKVANAIDDNSVASRLYTSLNLTYKTELLGSASEIYFNADNIFDVKPPKGFGWGYGLNASPTYDVIGPMFKVGLRFKR